ncbi:hypothetical protein AR543_06210 [Paenibacillus bovis]|uniref:Lipoprotein YerB n=2 Tax=Paenibacillus bovis TaxID=1616788 RepID=A0A172ZLY9_9BACL|nr:hypothetical protein AR543_06210 [Paenibacillus bovis]
MPVMLGISLTACQSEEVAAPPPTAVPAPEKAEPAPEPAVQTPVYTAPLTGLAVEQPDLARPVAVMINNAPAARPQSGLAEADMIYEVLAEGGITRLVAIYQSYHGDATIGPVRSIRPYLITLGETVNGLLVHAGGSTDAYAILQNGNKEHLDEITNASAPFWRDSSRKAPHNLYTNEQKLRKTAADKGYTEQVTLPVYPFLPVEDKAQSAKAESSTNVDSSSVSDESVTAAAVSSAESGSSPEASSPAVADAKQVDSIQLKYLLDSYTVGYTYDAASGLYTRSMNNKPHIDLNTKQPLTAANVIVLGADYKVLDDVGRLSLNLDAGGEALLFQQGRMIRGEWSRTEGDVIRFRSGGQETPLVPGVTYYNIVPNHPSFDSHLTINGEKLEENG